MACKMALSLPNCEAHLVAGGHFVAIEIAGQIIARLRQLLEKPLERTTNTRSQIRMSFKDKDHFSGHAACYQQFRPSYPTALFAYLGSLCPSMNLPGTVPPVMARRPSASRRISTASSRPTRAASRSSRQSRMPGSGISSPLPSRHRSHDATVDLVTVAQALHWLDLTRLLRRGDTGSLGRDGILAVWCYQLHNISPEIDAIVHAALLRHRRPLLAPRAQDRRRRLPNHRIPVCRAQHARVSSWSIPGISSTCWATSGSWSSTQRYRKQNGADPLPLIAAETWKRPGAIPP